MFGFFRKRKEARDAPTAKSRALGEILAGFEKGDGDPLEASLALHLTLEDRDSFTRFIIRFGASDVWILGSGEQRLDGAVSEGPEGKPYLAVFTSPDQAAVTAGEWKMANTPASVSALEIVFGFTIPIGIIVNPGDPHLRHALDPDQVLALRGVFERGFNYRVGGLFSVWTGEGHGILKLLATDDGGVHVRLYANRWPERPVTVDPAQLTTGTIAGSEARGIGHMPLTRANFLGMAPRFIREEPVTGDELEGHKIWAEAGGGYFG